MTSTLRNIVSAVTETPERIPTEIVSEDNLYWTVSCEGGCGQPIKVAKVTYRPVDFTDESKGFVQVNHSAASAGRCLSCGPFPATAAMNLTASDFDAIAQQVTAAGITVEGVGLDGGREALAAVNGDVQIVWLTTDPTPGLVLMGANGDDEVELWRETPGSTVDEAAAAIVAAYNARV